MVLSQLASVLAESVSCVYIDPPYNNNESYTHYEDRWCRSEWLDGIASRLSLLRSLLMPDGSLWVSIDDAEVHRVRLAAEEIFGPENFVTTIIWNHRKSRENRKVFSNNHEYILCFAKDAARFKSKRNGLEATPEILARYKNPDNDPRGPWQSVSANVQAGHATPAQFYTVTSPSGFTFEPPKGRCWAYNKLRMEREIALGNVYFGKNGSSAPRLKKFLAEARLSITPHTLWTADEVGTTEQAKKHLLSVLHAQDVFDTPKPEELIHRILSIATDPGDLVLDAYLGSGTTASVAHKMGRAYVGIEQGEHALTHCAARLRAVVAGEGGGASSIVGWQGGGGFDTFWFNED
jgi:adenine-specific DNA-methyltransferase